ncbi:winged helix-turn-helix transcriptional regulator [Tuwongella immobilis]|uniref:HTH hxlR-type domain-containing protein n=1 Tax=Tuwongella immobilis TaxID=692036 RepID=A0A6C2YGH2_9BACT|nr:helix-turn-helix domain-containing protein [Tuwongella immobilis]VIP00620.1 Putative transcriptional regulator OS=Synechococcus sp. (strain ATCC 27167 / PCC 6312) GN=Syn6312_1746 PE=4 SV=1: HxlR [Tuwongella immobilis]VTR96658.1 Putative transcriptional regulator OS=Synechococcus sp. (strain ATCC 27167 / PCC 6312) GN=Syn6312_1746 PE=4 SV=1: HxlR [Tuwongella immobilis]
MSERRRSPCPIACALDLFGDRWTLLIIRDLVCGKSLFKEFAASPERIATNILSDRLTRLTEHGLIEKFPSETHSGREAYRLTERGKTLLPILDSIMQWGLKYLPGTEARMAPSRPAISTTVPPILPPAN